MQKHAKVWAASFLVICGGLLFFGFGIGSSVYMPRYAVVYVDDQSRTFVAPQCATAWQNKPAKAFGAMRRTTAGEADDKGYEPDHDCMETGVFSQDGPSLSGMLLEKIGVFPRKKYWWDMPYRTEEGVVYPGTTPAAAVRAKVDPDGTPSFCYNGNPVQANGGRPELTPSQLDICGQFAIRHLKASGEMPTETVDHMIHRVNAAWDACSTPPPAEKGDSGGSRTDDEVAACVLARDIARQHALNTKKRTPTATIPE